MRWARVVWRYISVRRDLLATVLVAAVVMAIAELSIPWLIKEAIDTILGDGAIALDSWLLLTLAILGVVYLAHVVLLRFEAQMILHCTYDLRRRLFAHIHGQSLPFFQRHRSGELMHRVTSDLKHFEESTAKIVRDVPGEVVTIVGVVTLMLLLHVELAVLIIGFMIAAAVLTGYLGQPLPTLRRSAQRLGAHLTARFQESVAGVRTVQAFKNERHELSRLDAENRRILEVELREGKVYALMEPLGDMVELLGLVLVVWYGGHLILADEITAGALVAFIAYMEILARPLGRAESYFRNVQTSRAVGERLQDLFDDEEPLPERADAFRCDQPWPIEVQDVGFRHPGQARDILHGISFTVEAGEVVAIVGRNGAGKSTLIDLLLRLYDPTSGRILAAGVDLRAWDLEAWRRSAGVMTQDVFLFHGTIAENIAYGRPEAGGHEIEQAVQASGLDRLMARFPEGLGTLVGERGARLSGGERQSIALARLFLRRPRLLFLDEPTSQLDGEGLQHVAAALKPLMRGCTTFLITHSAETIQLADRVLFLDRGELVADGSHDGLFASEPRYRALWQERRRQLAPGVEAADPAVVSP